MKSHVGCIGLGVMGRPMALNLMRRSLPARLRPAPFFRRATGRAGCDCVRVPGRARRALRRGRHDGHGRCGCGGGRAGPGRHCRQRRPGLIVIDHSTIPPATARGVAAQLAARGVDFLDAPVSGGETGAINTTLSIMVGQPSLPSGVPNRCFAVLARQCCASARAGRVRSRKPPTSLRLSSPWRGSRRRSL